MKRKSPKTYPVQFRRKRNGKTNYKKRLKLLLAKKPRLVIRKSLKNITAQLVDYNPVGDKILVTTHSKELEKLGWGYGGGNVCSAYLVGLLMGKKIGKLKLKEVILDIGLYTSIKGSRLFAALKGVIDSGVNVPHSKEILPDDARVSGKHIVEYAKKLKETNQERHAKQFSAYLKKSQNPEDITKSFENVKTNILKM